MDHIDPETGFFRASRLCKENKRLISDWKRLDRTKRLIAKLATHLNVPSDTLIVSTITGQNDSRGTLVHPVLGLDICCWISTAFFITMVSIVNEATKQNPHLCEILNNAVAFIQPDKSNLTLESDMCDRLAQQWKAQREVECPYGKIDLMTEERIIEVKMAHHYKHAIGQIIAYGSCYPLRQKVIYLLVDSPENREYVRKAEAVCAPLNIEVDSFTLS